MGSPKEAADAYAAAAVLEMLRKQEAATERRRRKNEREFARNQEIIRLLQDARASRERSEESRSDFGVGGGRPDPQGPRR